MKTSYKIFVLLAALPFLLMGATYAFVQIWTLAGYKLSLEIMGKLYDWVER